MIFIQSTVFSLSPRSFTSRSISDHLKKSTTFSAVARVSLFPLNFPIASAIGTDGIAVGNVHTKDKKATVFKNGVITLLRLGAFLVRKLFIFVIKVVLRIILASNSVF